MSDLHARINFPDKFFDGFNLEIKVNLNDKNVEILFSTIFLLFLYTHLSDVTNVYH